MPFHQLLGALRGAHHLLDQSDTPASLAAASPADHAQGLRTGKAAPSSFYIFC
jgi:hypothetical protein